MEAIASIGLSSVFLETRMATPCNRLSPFSPEPSDLFASLPRSPATLLSAGACDVLPHLPAHAGHEAEVRQDLLKASARRTGARGSSFFLCEKGVGGA